MLKINSFYSFILYSYTERFRSTYSSQPVSFQVVTSSAPGQPNTTQYDVIPTGTQPAGGQVVLGGQSIDGESAMDRGMMSNGGYIFNQPPPYSSVVQPTYVQSQDALQHMQRILKNL